MKKVLINLKYEVPDTWDIDINEDDLNNPDMWGKVLSLITENDDNGHIISAEVTANIDEIK